MIAQLVYLLCALTSVGCAALLVRGYLRSRARLLFWSSVCFVGLALNNILLVVDTNTVDVDLSLWRKLPAVIGVAALIYGLVRDSR